MILMIQSKSIKRIWIMQIENGRFRVSAVLNNKEEERSLVTLRKTPREWASLDRLVRHAHQHYGKLPHTALQLFHPEVNK